MFIGIISGKFKFAYSNVYCGVGHIALLLSLRTGVRQSGSMHKGLDCFTAVRNDE